MRRSTVEHHVLEKVRQAGNARILITPPGTYKVVHDDIRDVVIGPDDDLQAIVESATLDLVRHGRRKRHPEYTRVH